MGHNAGQCENLVTFSATLSGNGDMGAVAGSCGGSNAKMKNCQVFGDSVTISITGTNRSAGGIVGYIYDGATLEYGFASLVTFRFGTYTGIDKKDLAPSIGYVVGHIDNATVKNVGAENCSIDYGGLPEEFWEWFVKYNPRKNVCSGGNGTYGSNDGGTVSNTTWNGVL